jgi:hypothetical protein
MFRPSPVIMALAPTRAVASDQTVSPAPQTAVSPTVELRHRPAPAVAPLGETEPQGLEIPTVSPTPSPREIPRDIETLHGIENTTADPAAQRAAILSAARAHADEDVLRVLTARDVAGIVGLLGRLTSPAAVDPATDVAAPPHLRLYRRAYIRALRARSGSLHRAYRTAQRVDPALPTLARPGASARSALATPRRTALAARMAPGETPAPIGTITRGRDQLDAMATAEARDALARALRTGDRVALLALHHAADPQRPLAIPAGPTEREGNATAYARAMRAALAEHRAMIERALAGPTPAPEGRSTRSTPAESAPRAAAKPALDAGPRAVPDDRLDRAGEDGVRDRTVPLGTVALAGGPTVFDELLPDRSVLARVRDRVPSDGVDGGVEPAFRRRLAVLLATADVVVAHPDAEDRPPKGHAPGARTGRTTVR